MQAGRRRNFHLPLDDDLYRRLRSEAARTGRPATELARNAIEAALRERQRFLLHESIAEYAAAVAGTQADLDPALERAGREHLSGRKKRRP
jgi:predicted DNA-binding protein